jgi:hypothetical protein
MSRPANTSFIVREEHSVWIGHYEYEQFIQELLNGNKQQATLNNLLNIFVVFYTCKSL